MLICAHSTYFSTLFLLVRFSINSLSFYRLFDSYKCIAEWQIVHRAHTNAITDCAAGMANDDDDDDEVFFYVKVQMVGKIKRMRYYILMMHGEPSKRIATSVCCVPTRQRRLSSHQSHLHRRR